MFKEGQNTRTALRSEGVVAAYINIHAGLPCSLATVCDNNQAYTHTQISKLPRTYTNIIIESLLQCRIPVVLDIHAYLYGYFHDCDLTATHGRSAQYCSGRRQAALLILWGKRARETNFFPLTRTRSSVSTVMLHVNVCSIPVSAVVWYSAVAQRFTKFTIATFVHSLVLRGSGRFSTCLRLYSYPLRLFMTSQFRFHSTSPLRLTHETTKYFAIVFRGTDDPLPSFLFTPSTVHV